MELNSALQCFEKLNEKIEKSNNQTIDDACYAKMKETFNLATKVNIKNSKSITMSDEKFRTPFTL